ncbi:WD40 repeat protein [Plasmopara halstedii]|uniref:Probable cytosolic iron-sulfur protein assembly protein CIAO1 homolog n=1 Tax=Plasmopara halstedii TaxID=4781 RepID=A0A0P1ACQ3_PLAHL|nr:WD40 repeat protein [Plasmopara halstedii]CEG38758.1 WD40 repeat protein [Plasmopara halstedii]|eukprot:XP_024575127.1 WD40 repeat protein [Plasmopara halstedii]
MTHLEHVCALDGHSERVWHVSWRFDGKLLASCSGDRTIRLWAANNTGSWECTVILEDAQSRTIRACEWSPDGRYLASVSFDGTTAIWEKQGNSYEVISSLEGHESEVKSVAWSPSGAYLATCSRDKSVWIWEADADTDFECISVLHGHMQDVKFVTWHPTEELLISASYDDSIRIWAENDDDWYCKETLTSHTSTVWNVALSPDGMQMASVSDDADVIVWQYNVNSKESEENGSSKQWKQAFKLPKCHDRTIFSVDWSVQGDYLVTGASDNAIRIFQGQPKGRPTSFDLLIDQKQAHTSDVNCVRWSPQLLESGDKKMLLLASAGDDALVRIWNMTI